MIVFALLCTGSALGASQDNLEVGGAWGSPTATNPTATWWNPAGLVAGSREVMLHLEAIRGSVDYVRFEPNGGTDRYESQAIAPFLGASSTVAGGRAAVGLAFAIPMARGGLSVEEDGAGRYAMRSGRAAFPHVILSGSGVVTETLSVGLSGAMVLGQWDALVDFQTVQGLDEQFAALGQESGYTDEDIEKLDYATTLDYQTLQDRAFTGGVGIRYDPDLPIVVGIAFWKGTRLDLSGTVDVNFRCPPQEDVLGRFGAELYGICDTTLRANSTVVLRLPPRLQAGVAWQPSEAWTVELMGGWVGWSVYEGYDITVTDVATMNELANPDTADLVEKSTSWARDNHDAFWAALDGKVDVGERFLLGGRVLYDTGAVPDATVSPANFDAPMVSLTGLVAAEIWGPLTLGLSGNVQVIADRTIEDGAFSTTLDPDAAAEARYFYPHSNGQYSSTVGRLGLNLHARF